LCKTLAGVECDVLTITEKEDFEIMNKKKAIIISARVHPGETVGSWMMRGVLFFLTDPDNEEAKLLRKNFIFKIIPMLNPDGVINGNYRCSLAGCDLNRRWKVPHKQLHPTIYHTKKLILDIHKERGLLLYCDLHGHSRK
jgi:murein tripeptide amidase MpaA